MPAAVTQSQDDEGCAPTALLLSSITSGALSSHACATAWHPHGIVLHQRTDTLQHQPCPVVTNGVGPAVASSGHHTTAQDATALLLHGPDQTQQDCRSQGWRPGLSGVPCTSGVACWLKSPELTSELFIPLLEVALAFLPLLPARKDVLA